MNPFVVRFLDATDWLHTFGHEHFYSGMWNKFKQEARVRHVQGVLPSSEAWPLEVLCSFRNLGTSVMAETKTSSWPPEKLHWESFSWDGFNWPSDSVPSSQLCELACFICLIECRTHHLAQVRTVDSLWLMQHMHDRQLATTLCKGLLCTRARRDIRLLKPLRKSQDVLSCLRRSVNDMKSSAVCHKLNYLCSKAQSVCELADLADCGFVDDWMLIQLLPHFNAGWMSANGITSQQHYIEVAWTEWNHWHILPWHHHDRLGWASIFCSDMFRPSMSRVFLNFATLSNRVNPCWGVDMLSMSKQPQVATKTCHVTCPFREVKRKKRRRCWKIATLRLSRSWTVVICHSGSMPWGATPLSDLFLHWKSASIKQWLEANKARTCMLFIIWIVVNKTNHNNKH